MGLSNDYDCSSSILLCAEDNISILGFDDEEEVVHGHGEVEYQGIGWVNEQKRSNLCWDSMMGSFPLQSDECMHLLLEREVDHLPRDDYSERLINGTLDPSIRRDAIDWIAKVHAYYSFAPLTAYLAVNYLDRFLSTYEIPQGKAWMIQLLSVACLSLAAKMEETQVPLSLDLQIGESKYVFEAKTIRRMELMVLSTLKWRMQAVTPFSFIDFFLHKFNEDKSPSMALLYQCMELILKVIKGVDFLLFRPSEVAAAVAISLLGESEMVNLEEDTFYCEHVEKERLWRCFEVIQKFVWPLKNASPSVSTVPMSPIGVLDAACLSYKSDDATGGPHVDSCPSSPAIKRRKIR